MEYYVHLLHLHWRQLAEHKVMPNSLFCVMKHSWMYIVTIFVGQWSFPLKFEYELRQCDTDFPVFTNSRSPVLIVLVERCMLRYAYLFFFSLSVLKKAHVHSANLSSNLLISNQTEMSSPFISPAWHCFHSKQFPFPCTNRRALHLDLMSFKVSTVVNAWLMGEDCL